MNRHNSLAPLCAILLILPRPAAAASPTPSTPRLARAQVVARTFHQKLRFAFQERSEEDRRALEQLISSGGLGPVIRTWKETRVTITAAPPGALGGGDAIHLTLAEAVRIADRAVRRAKQGYKWERGVATSRDGKWVVKYKAQGKAGLHAKVEVDARTGRATVK
jgi:hypothetical protein